MIIKKYKLFENKLELDEEKSKLLDLAIETGDLDLVKFFVKKKFRSSDETMDNATYHDDIFTYLLDHNYKLNIEQRRLNDDQVQMKLIDFGKLNYIFEKLGHFNIRLKSSSKYKKLIDEFFKKNPSIKAFEWSKDDKELCLYILNKGINYKDLPKEILRELEVQKALIDFGEEQFIHESVGFNWELKNNPKYKNVVDMEEQSDKFNI